MDGRSQANELSSPVPRRASVTRWRSHLPEPVATSLASISAPTASRRPRNASGSSGATSSTVEVDVCDYAAVHQAVEGVLEQWGAIDIVVNNAGKGQREEFTEVTRELWDYMLDVNLTSVFNVCSAVVPPMIAQGGGRIVTISSVAALRGGRLLGRTAYAAAKGGVIAFTKSLAFELAEHHITVNCIAPGIHDTPQARPGHHRGARARP